MSFDNIATYGFDYMDKSSSGYYGSSKFMDESAISTALLLKTSSTLLKPFLSPQVFALMITSVKLRQETTILTT